MKNQRIRVVAISGWKGSGKDTAAEALGELGFHRVSFADILKDMCADEYAVPRSYFDDRDFKESPLGMYPVEPKDKFSEHVCKIMRGEFREDSKGKLCWTPRALAILKGSVNRSVTSKYWTQRAICNIEKSNARGQRLFVIPDLRYKSEITELQKAFGDDLEVIRLHRFDDVESTDASERDLDGYEFDSIIYNNTTIEEFKDKIKLLISEVC